MMHQERPSMSRAKNGKGKSKVSMIERGGLASGVVLRGRMAQLRPFKRCSLGASLAYPHAIDNAHPDICQGSNSHTMGLALSSFALVIGQRPVFLQGRLPGELVQSVTQRFQAGETFVRFGVIAAFKRHRRRRGQGLDTGGISIAAAISAPFGQQTWSQALASPRQRTPQFLVGMRQKKRGDGLV